MLPSSDDAEPLNCTVSGPWPEATSALIAAVGAGLAVTTTSTVSDADRPLLSVTVSVAVLVPDVE